MLDVIAERVLAAVDRAAPEFRYEENSWQQYAGTNVILRQHLQARPCAVPYPMGGGLCDIVFDSDGLVVWIEVKQSWTWKTYTQPAVRNGAHHKHLFGETASALHDGRDRLPRLVGQPEADVIGLLVVGLDSDQLPLQLGHLDMLAVRAGLDRSPWQRVSRPRRRSEHPDFATIGVHAHLWLRPAHAAVLEGRSRFAQWSPAVSEQREVDADRTPVQREVLAVIRDLHQRHGSRWEWGGQLRSLFVACGLSKCEVDQGLRMSFQREMHQMIPIGEYSRKRVEESVDQIIALVQHYHRWASGSGSAAAQ